MSPTSTSNARERPNVPESGPDAGPFASVLRRCAGAAILCDSVGHVHDLNPEAQSLLRRFRDVLEVAHARIKVTDAWAEQQLTHLLEEPGDGTTPPFVPVMSLPDARGNAVLECVILKCDPQGGLHRIPSRSGRLILLRPVAPIAQLGIARLCRHFAITRAEADVLSRLMQGDNTAAIASARGSRIETIRSYIKTLLAKLDCHSQVELVSKAWTDWHV